MKFQTIFTVVIILFKIAFYTEAQENDPIKYDLEYELVYRPDTTNLKRIRREQFLLEVSNTGSCFQTFKTFKEDSIKNVVNKEIESRVIHASYKILNSRTSDFNYRVYYDYNDKKLESMEKVMSDYYVFTPPLDINSWEILDEKEEVGGYFCQKAEIEYAGRRFVAWFTDEISIFDGPYVFKGLPGLIIKLQDTKRHYTFSLLNLTNVTEKRAMTPRWRAASKIDFDNMSHIKALFRGDPIKLGGKTAEVFSMFDYEETKKNRVARYNNPMETNQ